MASLSLSWVGKVQYLSSMIKRLLGRLGFDTESKLSILQVMDLIVQIRLPWILPRCKDHLVTITAHAFEVAIFNS